MYAIIKTGGKQYQVEKGDILKIEKLDVKKGSKIEINEILLISDNGKIKVGDPFIKGAKVVAEVLEHAKGEKVIIYKYKSKKDYRKKQGHRQPYTEIKINEILGADAKESSSKSDSKAKPAAKKTEAKKPAPKSTAKKTEAKKPVAKPAAKKAEANDKVNLNGMKKTELLEYAKKNNVKVLAKDTKPVIIEKIESAMK